MTRAEFKVEINSCLDTIRQERGEAFVRAYFDKLADHDLFVTYPDSYNDVVGSWKMRLKFLSLEEFVSRGGSWKTVLTSLHMCCKQTDLAACYIWSARNYLYDMYGFDLLDCNRPHDSEYVSSMLRKAACLDDRYIYIGYNPAELLRNECDLEREITYLKHRVLWTLIATTDETFSSDVLGVKSRVINELLNCGFIKKAPASNCFCCDYVLDHGHENCRAYCPVVSHSIALRDRKHFFVSQPGCWPNCTYVGGYYLRLRDDSITELTRKKIAAKIALYPRSAFANNLNKNAGYYILSDCAIVCRYLCDYVLARSAEEERDIEERFKVWANRIKYDARLYTTTYFAAIDFKSDETKTFVEVLRATILKVLGHYRGLFKHDDSTITEYCTNDAAATKVAFDHVADLPADEKLYNKKNGDSMVKKQLDLLDEFVDCTTKLAQIAQKWMDLIKEMDRES